jgi:chromosome segregation ATPase
LPIEIGNFADLRFSEFPSTFNPARQMGGEMTEEHGEDLRAKRGADNKTLTAIRETQTEHGQKLDAIEGKLDNLGGGLRKADRALESVQADMAMVKGRLGKVEGRLGKVEGRLGKVEGRLGKIGEKLDLLLSR